MSQPYQQTVNSVTRTVQYYPTVILPTKYITDSTSPEAFIANNYSTTTQSKQVSFQPYQSKTNPVYYNYQQNNNNINYGTKYSGELERQTYQNNPNVKLAENYGLNAQNYYQNISVQKRPSAGMVQNYKNMNTNLNLQNMNLIPGDNNYRQYKEKKIIYVQTPQSNINSNINNMNNYYQNKNINNNNYANYFYKESNGRKYNYEYTDNSMYLVQSGAYKAKPQQKINNPQTHKVITSNNPIVTQQYNPNMKQNVNYNINNYIYANKPEQKIITPPQQIITSNQPKNIVQNPHVHTHHHNNIVNNNMIVNNQVNPNNFNNINQQINNMNNIPRQNKMIVTDQLNQINQVKQINQVNPINQVNHNHINQVNQVKAINQVNNINQVNQVNQVNRDNQVDKMKQINNQIPNMNQVLNVTGYPQPKVVQPQFKKAIPKPVVNNKRQIMIEEPPDNMRNRGKNPYHQNNEYFNNTMPNLKTYNDIFSGNNNIIPQETAKVDIKNNYQAQQNLEMSLEVNSKKAKANRTNIPQQINQISFICKGKTTSSQAKKTNPNVTQNTIVNNVNVNYQNNAQTQKNNNNIIINNNIKKENKEYIDRYGNVLVLIDGKFIDKRLLVNYKTNNNNITNNNIVNNNKQIINQKISSKEDNYERNNNITQDNRQFSNTYPLPGQKAYSTQTLINNNIDQNIDANINVTNNNYQNQIYNQRSNRFQEDQNFTNINNYNINLNLNQQNALLNDINDIFKKANSGQITQPDIQVVVPQKPKRRRPVFKIPPSKKRSISQGRSLNFIHKYYDENFILEEDNEDNASDSENKKTKKTFKNAVKEVMNIRRLLPNQHKEEEKENTIDKQNSDNILLNNEEIHKNENNEEKNDNDNNVIRLSHIGFSLERSSISPDNDNKNKNNNDINNEQNNNISNNNLNFDNVIIDKNIYEEKKIDLNENDKKIKRNIDMNIDNDNDNDNDNDKDDNLNLDKIDEKLNEKLKLYSENEKENVENKTNREEMLENQKLSGEITKPNIYNNLYQKDKYNENSKSAEIQTEQKIPSNIEINSISKNQQNIDNDKIIANNSSISQNLLRDSDISNIDPKFYEPLQDSIANLQISNINNNEEDKRISMNLEGHDLDKYFSKENEKKEIKKKEIDESLKSINSEGENRNSQQIVDNLEAEEEKENNNIQQKESGGINTNNEKLTTIDDIIKGNNFTSENSKKNPNNIE